VWRGDAAVVTILGDGDQEEVSLLWVIIKLGVRKDISENMKPLDNGFYRPALKWTVKSYHLNVSLGQESRRERTRHRCVGLLVVTWGKQKTKKRRKERAGDGT